MMWLVSAVSEGMDGMRIRVFTSALLLGLVLTSCSDKAAPRSDPSSSPSDASTPSSTPSAPGAPLTEAPRREHRVYPFTSVDLRRLPVTRVSSDALSIGLPPQIPWILPTPRWVYRLGDDVIPVPRGFSLDGRLGDQYVLTDGCTRRAEGCPDKPQGGVHLLSPDGTVTRLDHETGRDDVVNVVTSPSQRELAWVVDAPDRYTLYRFAAGDSAPTQLPDPAASTPGAFPRVVGFVAPGDLLIAVNRANGETLEFVRTSGKPAEWDARFFSVVAPGTLLGQPAFTRRRDRCLSRYSLDTAEPRWTRCYRWGRRPVEGFYSASVSSDARWLVEQENDQENDQVVVVDLRTGMPKYRIQFDHRVRGIRYEDGKHFLVVLFWQEHPEMDSWPIARMVRCDLGLKCERATADFEIAAYDMLRFIGD